jgi:hypothetical protein
MERATERENEPDRVGFHAATISRVAPEAENTNAWAATQASVEENKLN